MSFRLVPKSVTLNDIQRRHVLILLYFNEFGQLPGPLRKSSHSLCHLLMSSCTNGRPKNSEGAQRPSDPSPGGPTRRPQPSPLDSYPRPSRIPAISTPINLSHKCVIPASKSYSLLSYFTWNPSTSSPLRSLGGSTSHRSLLGVRPLISTPLGSAASAAQNVAFYLFLFYSFLVYLLGNRTKVQHSSSKRKQQQTHEKMKHVSHVHYRPHCSSTYVDAAYCYRPSSVVCRSVCRSVTVVQWCADLNFWRISASCISCISGSVETLHGTNRTNRPSVWNIRQ